MLESIRFFFTKGLALIITLKQALLVKGQVLPLGQSLWRTLEQASGTQAFGLNKKPGIHLLRSTILVNVHLTTNYVGSLGKQANNLATFGSLGLVLVNRRI